MCIFFPNSKTKVHDYSAWYTLTQFSKIWTKVNFFAVIFIDLKKEFDTVNHETLLAKLENYGVRGVINSWFRSYLTDQKENMEVNNVVSEAETTLCSVLQGSVLGPLLFFLYINDVYKSSS